MFEMCTGLPCWMIKHGIVLGLSTEYGDKLAMTFLNCQLDCQGKTNWLVSGMENYHVWFVLTSFVKQASSVSQWLLLMYERTTL